MPLLTVSPRFPNWQSLTVVKEELYSSVWQQPHPRVVSVVPSRPIRIKKLCQVGGPGLRGGPLATALLAASSSHLHVDVCPLPTLSVHFFRGRDTSITRVLPPIWLHL
jgi:hypothetical protein